MRSLRPEKEKKAFPNYLRNFWKKKTNASSGLPESSRMNGKEGTPKNGFSPFETKKKKPNKNDGKRLRNTGNDAMTILDSTIIIDYLKGRQAAIQLIRELLANGNRLKTTAFNYYEVYFGEIAFEKTAQKIQETIFFLDSLEILFPTLNSFKKSANIRLVLQKKGKTIAPTDLFIAGITLTEGETLCTQNGKHFAEIPEIKLKTY
jgi:predicted nucleic acid-binding protein